MGRRTTWSFSNRRHGRSQEDETSDANFLPTYEEGSLDSENILIKEPEELNPTSEAIMVETTDAPILEDSPLTTMADKQPEEATKSLVKKYRNYGERCGSCDGQEENPLCGSDGHTYPNACELDLYACRKYWDITVVSEGQCESPCPGVDLGMFSGFGYFRASNKGLCHHDFFRCLKAARKQGLELKECKACCQERFNQCFDFVSSKPWKAGIARFAP